MANTTWIHSITNQSQRTIRWVNGENPKFGGLLVPGQKFDYDGSGLCFPWVDHTKPEINKSIEFIDHASSKTMFKIFQSYNRDTIQWLLPSGSRGHANHAVDVAGNAGAGGIKNLTISQWMKPILS